MPSETSMGATLPLFPPEPPLLVLLRELCTGVRCHPCPDGVSVDYLAYAAGREVDDVQRVLDALPRVELVFKAVHEHHEFDPEWTETLWRPWYRAKP